MEFQHKTYQAGNAIILKDAPVRNNSLHSVARDKKENQTTDAVKRNNQKMRIERCQLYLLHNFIEGVDLFVTFTYQAELQPASEDQAKREFRNLINRLKTLYIKEGVPFLWIASLECSAHGVWHIHMILKSLGEESLSLLAKKWKLGFIEFEPLYQPVTMEGKDAFLGLAIYITKTPETHPTDVQYASFHCSRKLILPEPEIEITDRWISDPPSYTGYRVNNDLSHTSVSPYGAPSRKTTYVREDAERDTSATEPQAPTRVRKKIIIGLENHVQKLIKNVSKSIKGIASVIRKKLN